MTAPAVQREVDAAFRGEWGRVVATLIRRFGDWDLAEECAQEAFAQALARWPVDGVPGRPGAWLTTVAGNCAIDRLRRAARGAELLEHAGRGELQVETGEDAMPVFDESDEIEDDRLRLIFTCCHPALGLEGRVGLTLRSLAGLSTAEIARAFLVSEATMNKRLTRTAPSGAKESGGTVYFTEGSDATPNYIFPMTSAQVCSTTNINQLIQLMYRPLYWYGNDYEPTVDYNKSIGQAPVFSNGDKTVTIHLNSYKWSDGEAVTARDIELWMNLYKSSPATVYCGYVPGYFPDNVTKVSAPNASTVVFSLNRSYNPEWFLYNELSQIFPLPLAWDRTSLSQPAPTSDNGHLPDTTAAGAKAVYTFLDTQSKDLGTWASSPLWSVVDGPFKLQSFTSTGEATLVPNPDYSGAKPSISKFVELPFTSEAAIYNEIKSGGPKAVTIGNIPSQYAPQVNGLASAGYTVSRAASYSFNYFPLNFNNPTVGPIFRQLYFRQALQHLVDQQGWIDAFLYKTANPTYGAIPPSPTSSLVHASVTNDLYPFSVSAAKSLLTANGWKVTPGGTSTCIKPGSGSGECGAGIKQGEGIAFNIDYQSGVVAVEDEMNDLEAQARKVGININLTSHPFDTVISTAVACKPTQPTCKWTAQNWGAGWIYGPDYLPTGEELYQPGAVANYGSYSEPSTTKLIQETTEGPQSGEAAALSAYAKNISEELPVVFGPTSIGTYEGDAGTVVAKNLGGYAANALGLMNPEDWYFTK